MKILKEYVFYWENYWLHVIAIISLNLTGANK